jgi:hypothetical protein
MRKIPYDLDVEIAAIVEEGLKAKLREDGGLRSKLKIISREVNCVEVEYGGFKINIEVTYPYDI